MKKSIAFFFLLVGGSTLSMEDPTLGLSKVPSGENGFTITSKKVSLETNDNHIFDVNTRLANHFVSLKGIIEDLGDKDEVIPLPSISAASLEQFLSLFKAGKVVLSRIESKSIEELFNIVSTAEYLGFDDLFRLIRYFVTRVLSPEGMTQFEAGQFKDDLDFKNLAGISALKKRLLERIKPILMDYYVSQKPIKLNGHSGWIDFVAISPNMEHFVTGSQEESAKVWNRKSGQMLQAFNGSFSALALSPDGKTLISGSPAGILVFWDIDSGEPIIKDREARTVMIKAHSGMINAIAFSADGTKIVTCSTDGSAKVWDASGDFLYDLKGHDDSVSSVSISGNGDLQQHAAA